METVLRHLEVFQNPYITFTIFMAISPFDVLLIWWFILQKTSLMSKNNLTNVMLLLFVMIQLKVPIMIEFRIRSYKTRTIHL